MSSRDKILAAVRQNQPTSLPLPELHFEHTAGDLVDIFTQSSQANGTTVVQQDGQSLQEILQKHYPEATSIATHEIDLVGTVDLQSIKDPLELKFVDVAVLPAQLAVAENGALWVDESMIVHRVLPFICQHLILVVPKAAIVDKMHRAYAQISINKTGFGVFIAGPSKTADIEQSLVIGAQGARSLTVVLV